MGFDGEVERLGRQGNKLDDEAQRPNWPRKKASKTKQNRSTAKPKDSCVRRPDPEAE
jgi:hypothetical protein